MDILDPREKYYIKTTTAPYIGVTFEAILTDITNLAPISMNFMVFTSTVFV